MNIVLNFSFFPRIVQPVITILVNPIHLCFLRMNIISSNHADLLPTTNSVMMSSFDPQNIERRRQIALKALSERLSKTTESSRQQQQQQQQKLHNTPASSSSTTLVEIEQNATTEQSQTKQFVGV